MRLPVEIAGLRVDVLLAHGLGGTAVEDTLRPFTMAAEQVMQSAPEAELCIDSTPGAIEGQRIISRADLQMGVGPSAARAWACPSAGASAGAIIDRALRLVFAVLLLHRNGVLFHAAAYGSENGAVLFAGPSGAGKSTIAWQFPPAGRMADDTVALRRDPSGGWLAWSTPFRNVDGPPCWPRSSVLRSIYILQRASSVAVKPMMPCERLASLLASVLTAPIAGPESALALEMCSHIDSSVPVLRLARPRDSSVLSLLEASPVTEAKA